MQGQNTKTETINFGLYEKSEIGINANLITPSDFGIKNYIPQQIRDEIPTLNRMGYMKADIDPFSQEYIEYSSSIDFPVLELGCAYGAVVQKVLEEGGRIIANDLSKEHLSILFQQTPKRFLRNLYLYPGAFPNEIDIPNESVGAVLTARMFHFLDGAIIQHGLDKIYKWLVPNGKLFFIVVTPYHAAIRDGFLSVYQERVESDIKWPGVIKNQWEINPDHKEYVPPYLHVFDIPELQELLPKHGFKIDKIKLFDYPNDVDSGNKGHVGLIATKV